VSRMAAHSGDPGAMLPEALREILARRPREAPAVERCEMCGTDIPDEHGHVVNIAARALLCVCRPCYLLFVTRGAAGGRFLSVPDRYAALGDVSLDTAAWEELEIPVGIACLFHNSALGRTVALYPSPAGATESLLPLDAWPALVRAQPALATLLPDVEALLVRRRDAGAECYVVPIDACYELVGRLRREWRGFQGGPEAWRSVDAFFARVRSRSGIAPRAEAG
jgi:hypothetical protein